MVAKSFLRKEVLTKNFHQNILVEIFLWLQNHFLRRGFTQKFSSKCFVRKCFMVGKSFPRKEVLTKNFHQNFFGRKFFMVAKSFPRKLGFYQKFA
jgi:hypothetical protein